MHAQDSHMITSLFSSTKVGTLPFGFSSKYHEGFWFSELVWILKFLNNYFTFNPVFADVSMNYVSSKPYSLANMAPISVVTCLFSSSSILPFRDVKTHSEHEKSRPSSGLLFEKTG